MNKKKEIVPKFRFPKYVNSEQWISTELSSLLDYERPDLYIVESDNYKNEGIPVLTANKSFILGYTDEKNNIYSRVPVIIFDDFTTEKKYVDFPFKVKSSAIKILKPKGNNVLKFVFELMNTINFEAKEHKRYYISTYQKLFVYVPEDVKEQQKIADCLFSIDDLIDAESRKLKALEKYKKGLMQKLFPVEGKTLPEWRFPEFQGCGEWKYEEIGNIGEVITGKTPSTSDTALWDGDIQFVTPTDITENKYQCHTQRTVVKTPKMKVLPKHTIMFTCIASIGKMALSLYPCITNQQINSIIPKACYDNEFIYYSLLQKTPSIKSGFANSTLPIINKTDFSEIQIPVILDKKEQQKIADCLSEIDTIITEQSNKVEQLKIHKKGLMQGLFPSLEEVDV
ncbi:restriction endonuclease subunit S [Campylobacter jejuni]|nr:restriction endonuclease subunit S [Campylobacter jejuni]EHY0695181.1 restriction endonuclease subunit S [Campylobacter jejuni]EIB2204406.1 restriction endonuclease subunit S [Campylobacter jejuni]EJB6127537.1 restriction endonuclease subunit S [Campylobacter jejuni]EJT9472746.1 restriction endonuclease subunit S [Campylobacter jejuni]